MKHSSQISNQSNNHIFLSLLDDSNACADLLKEIDMMKKLDSNHHLVSMFGSNTLEEPYYILLEYAQYGDLKKYLIDKREEVSST